MGTSGEMVTITGRTRGFEEKAGATPVGCKRFISISVKGRAILLNDEVMLAPGFLIQMLTCLIL